MLGGFLLAGMVAGALGVMPDGAPGTTAGASLQQCYREVVRACGDGDGACAAAGVRACQALMDDSERARASAGANLRHRVLEIGAACEASEKGVCQAWVDRGRRKREIRQAEEAASSLFIENPKALPIDGGTRRTAAPAAH